MLEQSICTDLVIFTQEPADASLEIDEKQATESSAIRCHKNILSAWSPVFRQMFQHDCAESLTNEVRIDDCQSIVVSVFIKYLYTGISALPTLSCSEKFPWNELFAVAAKYEILPLCDDAVRGIMALIITSMNVFVGGRSKNEDEYEFIVDLTISLVSILHRYKDLDVIRKHELRIMQVVRRPLSIVLNVHEEHERVLCLPQELVFQIMQILGRGLL